MHLTRRLMQALLQYIVLPYLPYCMYGTYYSTVYIRTIKVVSCRIKSNQIKSSPVLAATAPAVSSSLPFLSSGPSEYFLCLFVDQSQATVSSVKPSPFINPGQSRFAKAVQCVVRARFPPVILERYLQILVIFANIGRKVGNTMFSKVELYYISK